MHIRTETLQKLTNLSIAYSKEAIDLIFKARAYGATYDEITKAMGYKGGLADIAFRNMVKRMEAYATETPFDSSEEG